MDERRRPNLRVIALLTMLAVGCLALAVAVPLLRPTPIHSYQDQVVYALKRRAITYSEITIGPTWPDHLNLQYGKNVYPYGMPVRVLLPSGDQANGWLECRDLERLCALTLKTLEIQDLRVPDLGDPPQPAWLVWLSHYVPVAF